MSTDKKIVKEFEVTLSVKCYLDIYGATAINDIEEFLEVWEEVHKDDCSIKIKAHKEVKVEQEFKKP